MSRQIRLRPVTVLALVLALAGCGVTVSTTFENVGSTLSSSAPSAPTCPNREGGECLGLLQPGTYATVTFVRPITYKVPEGWQNLEDLPGNFMMVAPGYDLRGVGEDSSEFIGIYASVAASNRECRVEGQHTTDQPGVAHTPEAITDEFVNRPGVEVVAAPAPASVGGLDGLALDMRMADDWTGICFSSPYVPLIHGVSPSGLDHGLVRRVTLRMYLLAIPDGTLGIEIFDYSAGAHLDAYSAIVDQIRFGAALP